MTVSQRSVFRKPAVIVALDREAHALLIQLTMLWRSGAAILKATPAPAALTCDNRNSIHSFRKWFLNGRFQATSAGWHTYVYPGGIFIRCTLRSRAKIITSLRQCPEKSSYNRGTGSCILAR